MWQGILGHDEVVEQFRQRLASGRFASTYLFLGPQGIGKRTFARRLAAGLLCTTNDEAALDPCGACDACQQVAAQSHPDVDEAELPEGKKFMPIELFIGDREHRNREGLCHNIAMRPLSGKRRIAIIDDADWLSIESANCLLKTLEEPPPNAVLILIGTSRSRQLPTILSRTQLVRFAPLNDDSLAQLLLAKGIAADARQAASLAARSSGSLSRAAEIADDNVVGCAARVAQQAASGQVEVTRLTAEITELVNAVGTEAQDRRVRLRQLAVHAADALRQHLREQCVQGTSPRRVLALLDRCLEVEQHIDRNANQNLTVEGWIDDLAGI